MLDILRHALRNRCYHDPAHTVTHQHDLAIAKRTRVFNRLYDRVGVVVERNVRGRRPLRAECSLIKRTLRISPGKPCVEAVSRQVTCDGSVTTARQQRDEALERPGSPPCPVNQHKWDTRFDRRTLRT